MVETGIMNPLNKYGFYVMRTEAIVKFEDRENLQAYLKSNINNSGNRGKVSAASLYTYYLVSEQLGLRISDILAIKKSDLTFDGDVVLFTTIKESKTGKTQEDLYVDGDAAIQLKAHCDSYPDSDYVFISSKNATKPVTRAVVWERLKTAAKNVGITENVGTHSMRKTMALSAWAHGMDDEDLKLALNHKSVETTRIYSGSVKYIRQAARATARTRSLVDARQLARNAMTM